MNKASNFFAATLAVATGAAVLFTPMIAQAAPPYVIPHGYGVNSRLHRQQERINAGTGAGQLSPRERYRLEERDSRIRTQEDRDRAAHGGSLTYHERNRLEREENRSSRAIYRHRHN